MNKGISYLPRRAADLIKDALQDTRVVVINGARQAGKTTLAEFVIGQQDKAVARYLDQPAIREAADFDPVGFVDHPGLMLIDEVHRVPDLWLAIKHAADQDPRPGRFLLTGSARLLELRSIPDALPGRAETIELWPLSQGEIDNEADGFIDFAFEHGASINAESRDLRKKDYVARMLRGGYPDAVKRETTRRRDRFFDNYLADIINREVKQVANIERIDEMRRLISVLAAQPAGMLNIDRISRDIGIASSTVRQYVSILSTIFVIQLILAWTNGSTNRAITAPKVMFIDTGLANYLSNGNNNATAMGKLLENFVLAELGRQLTWSQMSARLYHYRDRDQYEVDGILENNAGDIIGIEVAASETVRTDDFKGLRLLQRRLGSRFKAGFVLYCGTESLSFGQGLKALPISAIWTTEAP